MNWKDNKEIAAYFKFSNVMESDSSELRQAIVRKMASIHPDNNSGIFIDDESKNLWQHLNSAKEFIDNQSIEKSKGENHKQLIPMSQVMDLVKVITAAGTQTVSLTPSLIKSEVRSDTRTRAFLPRLGSGVFATLSAFFFTFPNTAKDNPIIGPWLQRPESQYYLLCVSLLSGWLFIRTWIKEKRQEELIDFLSSDEGLRGILSEMSCGYVGFNISERKFSLPAFTRAINLRYSNREPVIARVIMGYKSLLFGSMPKLSRSIVDKIALMQIEKLIQRGLIVELPHSGLDRMFELSEAAYNDIRHGHY
ncbi:hypothetical protein OIN57_06335 [Klebsiella pneumoniae]|uniref:hypothetical protein n=1 Tax=Klebsiella pneumoniae TaxID=573 RepID=UPI000DE6DF6E|nr:hypothetical protein [Klebsiella pneumoniae]MDM7347405.1 hypothetical protein [Klebsiella pneumoniae]MDT3769428.1 hypothetical protein [Klebsiella pneumoniae]MEC4474519.1 hypothetical protein [Klebsiella pneumoniae]TAI10903.1 hypothetical protein EYD21_22555 [Klebsiella pneumoniae]THB30549.1 hypothetical protein E6R63_24500 [Klebsiella pneumoniae]